MTWFSAPLVVNRELGEAGGLEVRQGLLRLRLGLALVAVGEGESGDRLVWGDVEVDFRSGERGEEGLWSGERG